jgi:hypothetical protein
MILGQGAIIEKAIQTWRDKGVKLLPPADEASIIATMRSIDRPVSLDVIELYRRVGGFEDTEWDSHLWSFWSLNRITTEHAKSKYNRPYILFADFCINSYLYCFRYENAEMSSVCIDYFNSAEPVPVASSVEEFFRFYLSKPRKLLM